MSSYYLTYEYDCKVELYTLCDIDDFQYYCIHIYYTGINMNFNTIFYMFHCTCTYNMHVHTVFLIQCSDAIYMSL